MRIIISKRLQLRVIEQLIDSHLDKQPWQPNFFLFQYT